MPRAPRTPPAPGQVLEREHSRAKSTRLQGGFPGFPLLFELSASTQDRPGADRSWEPLRCAWLRQIHRRCDGVGTITPACLSVDICSKNP